MQFTFTLIYRFLHTLRLRTEAVIHGHVKHEKNFLSPFRLLGVFSLVVSFFEQLFWIMIIALYAPALSFEMIHKKSNARIYTYRDSFLRFKKTHARVRFFAFWTGMAILLSLMLVLPCLEV